MCQTGGSRQPSPAECGEQLLLLRPLARLGLEPRREKPSTGQSHGGATITIRAQPAHTLHHALLTAAIRRNLKLTVGTNQLGPLQLQNFNIVVNNWLIGSHNHVQMHHAIHRHNK